MSIRKCSTGDFEFSCPCQKLKMAWWIFSSYNKSGEQILEIRHWIGYTYNPSLVGVLLFDLHADTGCSTTCVASAHRDVLFVIKLLDFFYSERQLSLRINSVLRLNLLAIFSHLSFSMKHDATASIHSKKHRFSLCGIYIYRIGRIPTFCFWICCHSFVYCGSGG